MKHEWRKHEKDIYMQRKKPEIFEMPALGYYTITGVGNPNSELFGEHVAALYALSYGIRMMHKNGPVPDDFFEYTVYPLEGIWSLTDKGIAEYDAKNPVNKNELSYKIMIRQPNFVDEKLAQKNKEKVMSKKDNQYLKDVNFEIFTEGLVVQMLHVGPFETESETFKMMEDFCEDEGYIRTSKVHRETYLSDPRKSSPDKLKTILRFTIAK